MLQPSKTSEPIPGYVVKERIGVGGYGEVWSAQAPGGLAKAIKFVYGYFDDERAAREMKALHRIKQVRHPFLLSLERFEIVDGQLIIVTELADMSLKDRFERDKEVRPPSIPRDELLGYLRDAADALDYMSENFSLQHLDVKPENLLLVGGRVKVADFGLVKDLHDVTASQMGGLTPIYAPPEVFDGRPSKHSDQYSLAIVFQEMLTGVLPFPGRTPAQLASQHLHARPRLAPLSTADQTVIARALAKDPQQRFSNCRELVDHLLAAGRGTSPGPNTPADWSAPAAGAAAKPADAADTDSSSAQTNTQVVGSPLPARSDHARAASEQPSIRETDTRWEVEFASAPAAVHPVEDLPPLELVATEAGIRPTLFLGLGGTAAQTLRRLRRRLRDRLGEAAGIPAIQMLLLDTDAKNVYQATQGDGQTALADDETLALPLRSAHDYTTDARNILQWLSRRWLYNIPRSQQTEGRRPLGRLALVDHAQQVLPRLRRALAEITSPEALAESTAATGLSFRSSAPRVFVIASTAGGTGGGMVLDIAYAVRKILADLELPDDGVCGILTHSTDRNPETHDLAIVNSFACLSELQHYAGTAHYPGDTALGLPAFARSQGTFPSAYFIHLGDELNDRQFEAATDTLASYLYLDALTPTGAVLDQCREPSQSTALLRSFGLATIGSGGSALPALAAESLAQRVIARWLGPKSEVAAPIAAQSPLEIVTQQGVELRPLEIDPAEQLAVEHAARLKLDLEPLGQQVRELVEHELGGGAETILAQLRATLDQSRAAGHVAQLLQMIGSLFGSAGPDEEGLQPAPAPLQIALERDLKKLAAPQAEAVREWILQLVEDLHVRVGGACRAKDWYTAHLRGVEAQAAERAQDYQEHARALEQMITELAAPPARGKVFGGRRPEKPAVDVDAAIARLIQVHVELAALQGLWKFARLVSAQVAAAGDQIKDLQRELSRLSGEFAVEIPWHDNGNSPADVRAEVRSAVAENLRRQMPELALMVDELFQTRYLQPQGGLRMTCQNGEALRSTLPATLRAMARNAVVGALRTQSIAPALAAGDPAAAGLAERLQSCVEAARPKLTHCGGAQRLLAIVPPSAAQSELATVIAQLVPPATVVHDSDADLVFCFELQDLAIANVAARLIDERRDFIEVAGRLHTRTDVSWSPLVLPNPPEPACVAL